MLLEHGKLLSKQGKLQTHIASSWSGRKAIDKGRLAINTIINRSQSRGGFDLENIGASPMRWYHGALDVNTSSSAARATVDHANRLRKNIDYKGYSGLDHPGLQEKHSRARATYD
jgi:hypothetical protein